MWDTCPEMRPDIKEVLDEINIIKNKYEENKYEENKSKENKKYKKCSIM
jgi:hypothetical protein